jgi:hypothetical protein
MFSYSFYISKLLFLRRKTHPKPPPLKGVMSYISPFEGGHVLNLPL